MSAKEIGLWSRRERMAGGGRSDEPSPRRARGEALGGEAVIRAQGDFGNEWAYTPPPGLWQPHFNSPEAIPQQISACAGIADNQQVTESISRPR